MKNLRVRANIQNVVICENFIRNSKNYCLGILKQAQNTSHKHFRKT
ncbi:hypothetical protein LEP1GSC074_0839 [Leptospira noguchii str. Hook]|uniref:Uncharacterized protein n=1 Tax=Leptospira noguchii serovar Autumnalis str. ZUN142 TaxID=1085540 RepID=M6UUP7_9LEPT|nr:hypothetical protein LEP1GSC186_4399 [Leptospira noguchii serovar Autumnalis str. ZUN142]EMS83760.1 hypothetical protein LEP1GSC074_0839 [Leptospira noguchii str. Hook]